MNSTKLKDFTGESIYVGIDSHLKSWKITLMSDELELRSFTQPAESETLIKFLNKNYPGASFKCVYEAGFGGYQPQRILSSKGIECIVINPLDVPTSDKEKRNKSDQIDSRKLARGLKNNDLKGIYIPSLEQQEARALLRVKNRIGRDSTRIKNRIKFYLMFFGIKIPAEFTAKKWTNGFVEWLNKLAFNGYSQKAFDILIKELKMLKELEVQTNVYLKELSEDHRYKKDIDLLFSIPGIGKPTALVLLTEIGDINRFNSIKSLCSYCGLIPDTRSSGESTYVGRNTRRGNKYLKHVLVECAWMAIRYDPALLLFYKESLKSMEPNKAIIKVTRKLLNRIRFVLKNKISYVNGVM
jgi:transposase